MGDDNDHDDNENHEEHTEIRFIIEKQGVSRDLPSRMHT